MLHARARARSSSHSFCMVFSVNLEIRPILSLISLSLLVVVQVHCPVPSTPAADHSDKDLFVFLHHVQNLHIHAVRARFL